MDKMGFIRIAHERDKKQTEVEMILFSGKAKDMTYKELFLAWYYGRLIELLEAVDFSFN